MARNTLIFNSVNDGVPHEVRIFDDTGAQVGGVIAATTGAAGSYKYTATVPATLPTGYYAFSGYRTSNGRLRAGGEIYWDNATQCIVDTEEVELDQAAVQTAVDNALTAYGAPTNTDLTAVQTSINNNVDAAETTITSAISGLNDLSAADVQAELVTYDAATGAELTACCNDIQNDIAALNDLSSADISAALVAYDGVTQADLDAAENDIVTAITNNAGLTPAQVTLVEFIRDILEADEVYTVTGGTGTAQKLLKGTSTVLVDKDVTTNTPCDISTSIIEAP